MLYAYFGHHRCATLWTAAIVRAVSRELGLRVAQEDRYEQLPDGLDRAGFLIHLNATQGMVQKLEGREYRAFHVIRDPRDILVSSYFSDLYSHPVYRDEFAEFRERLESLSPEEGMLLELERRVAEFNALEGWDYRNPRICETRYEELTTKPVEEFSRIFGFLGIPMPSQGGAAALANAVINANRVLRRAGLSIRTGGIPPAFLQKVVQQQSFQKLAGRQKGQEDPKSHYRKGIAGDWVNHITGATKDQFKARWGRLLIDLGYEQNLDW